MIRYDDKTQIIDDLLNNINGYSLDNNQKNAILCDATNTLIVAGAGTGKTLTLLGKIRYLIEIEKIKENEILCISFTNDSTNSLKDKIKQYFGYNIEVLTFHKLSLKILKNNNIDYTILDDDYLSFIVEEFLYGCILSNKTLINEVYNFLGVNSKAENYQRILKENEKQLKDFKALIARFISLYKGKFKDETEFKNFFKINNNKYKFYTRRKNHAFLIIAYSVYCVYERELINQHKMDFNDMINYSVETVKEKGISEKYKYILIDEYQDTSYIKCELIRSIMDKLNSKIVCVGDDFQSIYRFAGCNLDIFLNFEKYFGPTHTVKLEKTYRNSQELLDITSKFITKNPNQIKKNLSSPKRIDRPVVITFSKNFKETLENLIIQIYIETQKPILIIGRNNFDIDHYIDNNYKLKIGGELIYKPNLNIKIRYLTAHKSKGLEEENVILINCVNDLYGFPNKVKDDEILNFLLDTKDNFEYEEERRLFYVALTRTKNKVYIITSRNNRSVFVKELIKDNRGCIEIIK